VGLTRLGLIKHRANATLPDAASGSSASLSAERAGPKADTTAGVRY
jgi:hypothetical protein